MSGEGAEQKGGGSSKSKQIHFWLRVIFQGAKKNTVGQGHKDNQKLQGNNGGGKKGREADFWRAGKVVG